ncbi:M28 family metallopeptidase [Mucilaginibacter sp. AW1-7]|uniref:M28 family metallopeptidase n=1 Tax=Mucilaginibacter sp. AW1-7 TaxID=3349874 RepID=UPI003F73D5A3
MNIKQFCFLLLFGAVVFTGCKHDKKTEEAAKAISPEEIKEKIAVLAADSMMGRKPFTAGENKAIAYISSEFKKAGLEPGNNGSYYQDVPMVEVTSTPSPTMEISGGKSPLSLHVTSDFVAFTRREVATVELKNSPLVFAGYGVVAPEYHWNDYAGLDVKGKTVVVLVNDPGFKSGRKDLFKGDTMTYYGRWTYKFEEAARQGAAGVIIVHQTAPASYGWNVVSNSNSGAKLYLTQPDKHMNRCKVEGWITEDAAKKLFADAGINGDLRAIARDKNFKAIPLNRTVNLTVNTKLKYSTSHNVIGILKGSARPTECVLYTAHWDHLGIGKPNAKGDSIYNGAIDNADGVASIIGIANAFKKSAAKPQRSIVFLAVTGEEQGLLGSEYYATHLIYPLNKTVADLNIDAIGDYGETKDIAITGKGQNELEDYVGDIAQQDGLTTVGDRTPGSGSYYRSDHFNFAKLGVPALDINIGSISKLHDGTYGADKEKDYNENRYHQQADNYMPDMDATGMAQIADILFRIGTKLGNEIIFPGWKPGSEFKAIRDKTMAK